jgi:pimeloyl-ACP methyl ester carboxylesterase
MKTFLKLAALILLLLIAGTVAWFWTPDRDPEALRALYANEASQFIELPNGLTVHVRDQGPRDAPVLVLVHGASSSLHTWEPWVGRLSDGYRIVTLDLQGRGLTGPHPDNAYSAAAFVETVDGVADALGLTRFTLGGNSMGGWVAWNYALAHGSRLEGLLLIDAAGAPDARPQRVSIGMRIASTPGFRWLATKITPRAMIERSLRQSLYNQAVIDDAMIDRYHDLLRYPGNRAALSQMFRTGISSASAADMARITVPVLILWGDEDVVIPLSAGEWFHAHLPGSRFIHYPAIGHVPMEEAPGRSAADVRAWLDGIHPTEEAEAAE